MTNPIITTDDDSQKLTKREEAHVKDLEHLEKSLEEANLLYGSALDGMEPGLKAAADALAGSDIDSRMAVAEEDLAAKATAVLRADVDEMTSIAREIDDDEAEQDALLAEEEAGPQE